MFLVGVVCSISILLVNVIVYMLGRQQGGINPIIVIIIGSVTVGIIMIPLLGFLIFHLWLTYIGKTTR
jgi:hypothetical protein